MHLLREVNKGIGRSSVIAAGRQRHGVGGNQGISGPAIDGAFQLIVRRISFRCVVRSKEPYGGDKCGSGVGSNDQSNGRADRTQVSAILCAQIIVNSVRYRSIAKRIGAESRDGITRLGDVGQSREQDDRRYAAGHRAAGIGSNDAVIGRVGEIISRQDVEVGGGRSGNIATIVQRGKYPVGSFLPDESNWRRSVHLSSQMNVVTSNGICAGRTLGENRRNRSSQSADRKNTSATASVGIDQVN